MSVSLLLTVPESDFPFFVVFHSLPVKCKGQKVKGDFPSRTQIEKKKKVVRGFSVFLLYPKASTNYTLTTVVTETY